MKITICGSIAFIDRMLEIKSQLEKLGHQVDLPPTEIADGEGRPLDVREFYKLRKTETNPNSWIWDSKRKAILDHFQKIEWCDAILVLNIEKNNIPGYIGANTFLEMGLALYLNKPIYLYDEIPAKIPYFEEILGCRPILLNRDLEKIGHQ